MAYSDETAEQETVTVEEVTPEETPETPEETVEDTTPETTEETPLKSFTVIAEQGVNARKAPDLNSEIINVFQLDSVIKGEVVDGWVEYTLPDLVTKGYVLYRDYTLQE